MLDCADVPVLTTLKLNCDCCVLSAPPLPIWTVRPPIVGVLGVLVRVAVGPTGVLVRVAVGPTGVLLGVLVRVAGGSAVVAIGGLGGGWNVGVLGVLVRVAVGVFVLVAVGAGVVGVGVLLLHASKKSPQNAFARATSVCAQKR